MVKGTAEARRPLASRSSGWAKYLAARLTASRVTPNQISVLSIAWAALGGALLLWSPGWPAFIVAAACVQLRLLCNLLDGMVAIEGGKSTATGALFNEMPDRLSDALFLVPLGYVVDYPWLGWLAALLAVLTGPCLGRLARPAAGLWRALPKQRRMEVLTVALLIQAIDDALWGSRVSLPVAVIIIAAGSLVTCISRSIAIARRLEAPRVAGEAS